MNKEQQQIIDKMKNLTFAFIFIPLFSMAQTSLDKIVFQKINKYRDSIGVPKLVFNSICYKASDIQSTYLKSVNLISHSNPNKGLETMSDRYKMAGGVEKGLLGEICNGGDFGNYKISDALIEEKIATKIVALWKGSKDHNEIMTSPNMKFGGVSVKVKISEAYRNYQCDIKICKHYDVFSVMVLSN